MIILRQKTYATSASFKPKFRKRFRNGDFSYVQAKNPAYEGLNHQAYREVAAEDEFKNNPETYKIRQGMFSKSYGPHPGKQPTHKQLQKFRIRFRKGNYKYSRAKKSEDEASNLAAYRVVAGEDEFKKNREARKIKSGQIIYSINNDNMILLKNNYYEEEDQRLFSTGDSELDDILEEVYYSGLEDGYNYAQREFAVPVKAVAKASRPALKLKPIKPDINKLISMRTGAGGAAKVTEKGTMVKITDAKAVNNLPKRVRSELGFKGKSAQVGDKIPTGVVEQARKVFSE